VVVDVRCRSAATPFTISTAGVLSTAGPEDVTAVCFGVPVVVVAVCFGVPVVVVAVCCGMPEVVGAVCCGMSEVMVAVFILHSPVTVPAGVDMLSSFPLVFDNLLSFCRILSCAKVGDIAAISNGDWLRDLLHNSFKFSLLVSSGNSNASEPVHVVVSTATGACVVFSSICLTNFLLELFRTIFLGFFFCIHWCDKHSVAVRRLLQPTNIHTQ